MEDAIQKIAAIIDDPVKTEAVVEILQNALDRKRDQRKQVQADGIRAAQERGVQFGRPRLEVPENFPVIYEQYQNKAITVTAASQLLNISRGSFRRLVERYLDSLEQNDTEQPEAAETAR
jgi:DNA invertase Pin-like site-specific DNA recombinase